MLLKPLKYHLRLFRNTSSFEREYGGAERARVKRPSPLRLAARLPVKCHKLTSNRCVIRRSWIWTLVQIWREWVTWASSAEHVLRIWVGSTITNTALCAHLYNQLTLPLRALSLQWLDRQLPPGLCRTRELSAECFICRFLYASPPLKFSYSLSIPVALTCL